MASPNAFLSSPSGRARRRSHFFDSSSPGLPSVQEILSQASRNPPFLLGSKVAARPEDAKTKAIARAHTTLKAPAADNTAALDIDDSSVSVVEVPADSVPKPRKPRRRKEAPEKRKAAPKQSADNASPTKDQPVKKRKPKTAIDKKSTDALEKKDMAETSPGRRAADNAAAQPTGSPVSKPARKTTKAKKEEPNEPLQLEQAMTRRLDWTPPTQKAPIILDSDSSALRGRRSPAEPCEETKAKSFERLLQGYKCTDNTRQDSTGISDEDSSFLRKRKLIELVATTVPNPPAEQVPEKSPMKQKAPKKKPRTITELATAAYRAPDSLEAAQATAASTKGVADKGTNEESGQTVYQGKGKAIPKKRTSKAKKKKPSPPPKPVLLPPSEALKEVAKQDFIFGTSSQLAVENSPTFLRNLQAAMKDSNRLDEIDFATPLNSDAIELPEQRAKMWGAGARDVDGHLFDLEVNKIAEEPSQSLPPPQEDDSFGYFQVGGESVAPGSKEVEANNSRQDDPFVDLSDDDTRSPGIKPLEIIDDDTPFSDSQISTGSPVRKSTKSLIESRPKEASSIDDTRPTETNEKDVSSRVESQHQPARPSYELYTDAQLSREITSYGFKAVKSRKTKIALLEQCWQSKARVVQGNARTIATMAATRRPGAGDQEAATTRGDKKRPRGRPRKNSASLSEVQEPPPSAQPPESPKRPRGRPKKDATASPQGRAAVSKQKKRSVTVRAKPPAAPTTPQRKARSSKVVIEIPDSASEYESDASTTAHSSPEPTFSPAPDVDLSLSVNDDADASLALNSADGEWGMVFACITKAITSEPRTADPANPSWNEKILLYDPIVLEDLTAWLNCGHLTRAGFDLEVSTAEVKKWCESRSVCCLWKVNLRGRERKRY